MDPQRPEQAARPISTHSIVAFDPDQRAWGIAVQSKFLAAGALVPWLRAEVGAVATQAWANVAYGPDGLALLEAGRSAQETIDELVAADEGREHRQLGIVDAQGRAASFTGGECLPWAGGATGSGYAAQGNLLVSSDTVDALASAFESTAGRPLADRLLIALESAQSAGGDRRGQQSAALKVLARGGGYEGCDVVVDLRVDDSPSPLAELARLYELHQLYFGSTPEEEWVRVDSELRAELASRLAALGYDTGQFGTDLEMWAATENFEERIRGAQRLDPVVIEQLRSATAR